MDWSKGYSATYYMTKVDPISWRDKERFDLTGGSIKREVDGLRESASIDVVGYPTGQEDWIRVYLDAGQEGDHEHVALFTGLATSPGDQINGTMRSGQLDCYSVLKPADDIALLRGWYAPMGSSGGNVIRDLLGVISAPIDVADDAPVLTSHIIAEEGETRLTMAEKILLAIDWRLKIAGDGSISIEPASKDPVVTFDPLKNDMIETTINVKTDWFDAPNVFLAVDDDLTAIAKDESLDSPLSIPNRGREVWMQESGCDLASSETIAEYAARRLKEEQIISKTASYDRRFFPGVIPGDYVRLHYPAQGLDDSFFVNSQSIDLGYAARTSEDVAI